MSSTEKVLKAKIQAIDNFTKPMQKVISQTKTFQATAKAVKPLVLKAKDMASKVISKVKAQVDKFKATKFGQFILKAKDMASKVLSKVNGTLRAFAGKVWSATVSVKDKASSVLSSIQGKLSALALGATIGVAVKSGVDGLGQEQTQKLTINRVLTNSGMSKENAKKEMENYYSYLENYANKTPFETKTLAEWGTKSMMISKGDVDLAKKYTDAMANTKAFVGDMRTEYEVGQSFHEASLGNMTTLNNMLGSNYETLDEALEGIAKNQSGLVDEMSTTLPGLMSTITGKIGVGLKNVAKVFADMLSGSMSGIIGFIDSISPKMVAMAEAVKVGFEAFAKSEQASQYMQIFKTVFEVAWNLVKATIEAVRPVIEAIFNFIASHSTEISAIVKTFGTVWQSVWKTVGVLLQGAWSICEPILSTLVKALAKVSGAVEQICSWWNKMTELLKKPINAVVNVAKKGASFVSDKLGLSEGRNAFGSGRIARDGTVRTLHEGEKILTKQEANRYDKGQNTNSINVVVNGLTVREESDINKIASQLLKKINESKIVYGGAY
nr:MAG TPA: hypothetical protein [Caudoviricetes sp.]